ncbi:MAG: hypothetical protein SXV54_06060, partial [Chloroflexota bacterium]|nr:hypothetical protein [Chloroflexota bacterium]
IAAGGYYECSFDATVSGNAGYVETDLVTASGSDDDSNPVSGGDTATVTITDVPSSIGVTKSANPTEVAEPGGLVEFSVRVDNTSVVDSVTITSLNDSIHGDLNGQGDCSVPQPIAAGGYYECSFDATVSGNAGYVETDLVTASGSDDDSNPVSGDDTATVTVTDVPSSIGVTKSANPTEVAEPGGLVEFSVRVDNTSAVDSVTITSLNDSIHGDLNGQGDCSVPQPIAAGGYYECTFDATVSGNAGYIETDLVTASGSDDDSNPVSGGDTAIVTVTDVEPTITVEKSASPSILPEPGGTVEFGVRVNNTGVEPVTLTALGDDVYGDITNASNPNLVSITCALEDILAGESYDCTFEAQVSGEPGDYPNTVIAMVEDDEDNVTWDSDGTTVTITDVTPTIEVAKSADPTSLFEPGGTVEFSVRVDNTGVEPVTLTALEDDVYGDVTDVSNPNLVSTACALVSIPAGGFYECEFEAQVSGEPGVYADTVTATAEDNEGNSASDYDEVSVTITNVAPTIAVIKDADPSILLEPGGTVEFRVQVDNTGVEPVTLTALGDDVYGDITDTSNPNLVNTTCALADIPTSEFYECTFEADIFGEPGVYSDTVTAIVEDNEGTSGMDSDDATVIIADVDPTISVTKTADPISLGEPGGTVEFSVQVNNTSDELVHLTWLLDDVYGDVTDVSNPNLLSTTCALVNIPAGGFYECAFEVNVFGEPGVYSDTVTVIVEDNDDNVSVGSDDAVVTITDVTPTIEVTKSADPTALPEPGGTVQFSVLVDNTGVEPVTLTTLEDDVYGDVTDVSNPNLVSTTCALEDILAGGFYECEFEAQVSGEPGVYTDTVTVAAEDNEGNSASDDDTATVTITGVSPTIEVTKSANPTSLSEPGGTVQFGVRVDNTGVETVTLTALGDDVYGDLTDTGNPNLGSTTCALVNIPAGEFYECGFEAQISGEPGAYTDTVTATVEDNEGASGVDSDETTVTITDVAPSISVVKSASPSILPEPGGTVEFSVQVDNTSVELVTLTALGDDVYGDVADTGNPNLVSTTCALVNIPASGFYECEFEAQVSGGPGIYTDTVTVTAEDNEGNSTSGQDDAAVTITDMKSSIQVTKTADPSSLDEPGGLVEFTLIVENISAVDRVTITNLMDDPYGDLTDPGNPNLETSTCQTPQTLQPGASYECTFQVHVSGNAGDSETDTVTVVARDDDDNPVIAADSATVILEDVLPSILTTKTATPTVIHAGDAVDFTIQVHNQGVETVTLTGLGDSVFGDLAAECGLPADIAVGDFFECDIARAISADHTNTVTATVEDDEGNEVTDSASASVNVIAPAIQVVKEASVGTASVSETITYTYTVENIGDVNLTDVRARDDRLGDIVLGSTVLAPGESTTGIARYLVVESDLPGPITNTVTVTGTPPASEDVTDTDVATVYVEPAPVPPSRTVYLPIVLDNRPPPAPDLVVEHILVTSNNVQVTIKNQGNAPVSVSDGFWVDLYVNPKPVPTGVNQLWVHLCAEGIVWGVTEPALPLEPGEGIVLTIGDGYYWPEYSNFPGSLPVGTPIYVQVDSADASTNYGAVLEDHEMVGGRYNNISGPVFSTSATSEEAMGAGSPSTDDHPPASPRYLPPRP